MSQIKAGIIADSKSSVNGKRITTFELEYPRFIHSELMTHRMFSRNAMSSRAVPIEKMIEQVRTNPAMPTHWGKNQPGMKAKEQLDFDTKGYVAETWCWAAGRAASAAETMQGYGAHKQIVNRILEPFQMIKTVLTATEFDNFFWLRNHEDAQPEIKKLASLMLDCIKESEPVELTPDDWHTPYFGAGYWLKEHQDTIGWYDKSGVSVEEALAISASCCAQVSYRVLDNSLEKAEMIYKRLVESKPVHASPFEHQAKPMDYPYAVDTTELSNMEGATHLNKNGEIWSGNFKGWIQHRQLISDNVYEEK